MKNIIIILRLVYAALFITMSSAVFSQNCIEKCEGECITYTASETGGTGPYTYLWDDNTTLDSLVDCTVGVHMHSVTVTDANGCIAVQTAQGEIFSPFPLSCRYRLRDPIGPWIAGCTVLFCDNDGRATQVDALPLDDSNNCILTDPNNNTYTANAQGRVILTDAQEIAGVWEMCCDDRNGCETCVDFTFVEDVCECDITPTAVATDITCNGANDGIITVTENGVAPYTYAWTGGTSGNPATGLSAGTYTVTVTDADGCTGEVTATVNEPTQLTLACSSTDESCAGPNCSLCDDGTATVVASGGTAPYTYLWDDLNASTTANVTGLPAGTYTVTVTDANGCTETCSVTIIEPTLLTAAISCN